MYNLYVLNRIVDSCGFITCISLSFTYPLGYPGCKQITKALISGAISLKCATRAEMLGGGACSLHLTLHEKKPTPQYLFT